MVIGGNTRLMAHLSYLTTSFKAPIVCNPWFVSQQVGVKVVPMGVRPEDYAAFIPPLFMMTNIIGTLVMMPHRVATCDLIQHLSPTATIAGAYNVTRRETDGNLSRDMFDGDGFMLGLRHKGSNPQGTRTLVVGSGRVGSAITASLTTVGVSALTLYDTRPEVARALAGRLHQHYPQPDITLMQHDPVRHKLVVNATPLGMKASDPPPLDVDHPAPGA